jgi:hypothetical protein
MFDASQWAERIARDAPSASQPAESPKGFRPDCSDASPLMPAELAAFQKRLEDRQKRFEDQLYRDLEEAIPAHVERELRRNGGIK